MHTVSIKNRKVNQKVMGFCCSAVDVLGLTPELWKLHLHTGIQVDFRSQKFKTTEYVDGWNHSHKFTAMLY